MIRFLLATILLIGTAIALQEQTPPGEDSTPRPGQPLRCNNFFKNEHKCECSRAKECPTYGDHGPLPQDPSSKCQTWCRKSKCGCLSPCTSGVHKPTPARNGE
jgi:hypothetical protein